MYECVCGVCACISACVGMCVYDCVHVCMSAHVCMCGLKRTVGPAVGKHGWFQQSIASGCGSVTQSNSAHFVLSTKYTHHRPCVVGKLSLIHTRLSVPFCSVLLLLVPSSLWHLLPLSLPSPCVGTFNISSFHNINIGSGPYKGTRKMTACKV